MRYETLLDRDRKTLFAMEPLCRNCRHGQSKHKTIFCYQDDCRCGGFVELTPGTVTPAPKNPTTTKGDKE